jgi:Fe2+ or Zn2+ uptake regulation protein
MGVADLAERIKKGIGDTLNNKIIEIENVVKSKGYKMTQARKTIIRVFVESSDHLKPEDIYQLIRGTGVSIATVYRNIGVLKRISVIKEIAIHNERFYELNMFSEKKLHLHFQCKSCGKIKEYADNSSVIGLIRQRESIENIYGDLVEDITFIMEGICKECRGNT